MKIYSGIDVGSSTTKAVVINEEKEILGYAVQDSGADFRGAADTSYRAALESCEGSEDTVTGIVSTGYGRKNVSFANETYTEISCHAKGSFFRFSFAHTLIDIGGQDSKVIRIDDSGRRVNFKMNRKCAAGTGAFLEDLANRLKVPLENLNSLAKEAQNEIRIGSYCTVFTATEILTKIREGVAVNDIVRGIFDSVIKRAVEMAPLDGQLVMSGGVIAYNPFLVEMFEQKINMEILVPSLPQFTGALGAALYAMELQRGRHA